MFKEFEAYMCRCVSVSMLSFIAVYKVLLNNRLLHSDCQSLLDAFHTNTQHLSCAACQVLKN